MKNENKTLYMFVL